MSCTAQLPRISVIRAMGDHGGSSSSSDSSFASESGIDVLSMPASDAPVWTQTTSASAVSDPPSLEDRLLLKFVIRCYICS